MRQEPISPLSKLTTEPTCDPPAPLTCSCGAEAPAVWIGTRWISRDTCDECVEKERSRGEEDAIARLLADRLKSLKLSPKAAGFTFETFRSYRLTPSQAEAAEIIESGASAWLWGTCGVGKTHLATAAAIAAVHAGDHVERWIVADLNARLRTLTIDGRPSDVENLIRKLRSCELLVLDDLGAEKSTDFVRDALFRIVDYRAEWSLRTIVTSNEPPSKAAVKTGARIHSRLLGLCQSVKIEGHADCPDARLADRRRSC